MQEGATHPKRYTYAQIAFALRQAGGGMAV